MSKSTQPSKIFMFFTLLLPAGMVLSILFQPQQTFILDELVMTGTSASATELLLSLLSCAIICLLTLYYLNIKPETYSEKQSDTIEEEEQTEHNLRWFHDQAIDIFSFFIFPLLWSNAHNEAHFYPLVLSLALAGSIFFLLTNYIYKEYKNQKHTEINKRFIIFGSMEIYLNIICNAIAMQLAFLIMKALDKINTYLMSSTIQRGHLPSFIIRIQNSLVIVFFQATLSFLLCSLMFYMNNKTTHVHEYDLFGKGLTGLCCSLTVNIFTIHELYTAHSLWITIVLTGIILKISNYMIKSWPLPNQDETGKPGYDSETLKKEYSTLRKKKSMICIAFIIIAFNVYGISCYNVPCIIIGLFLLAMKTTCYIAHCIDKKNERSCITRDVEKEEKEHYLYLSDVIRFWIGLWTLGPGLFLFISSAILKLNMMHFIVSLAMISISTIYLISQYPKDQTKRSLFRDKSKDTTASPNNRLAEEPLSEVQKKQPSRKDMTSPALFFFASLGLFYINQHNHEPYFFYIIASCLLCYSLYLFMNLLQNTHHELAVIPPDDSQTEATHSSAFANANSVDSIQPGSRQDMDSSPKLRI